MSDSDGRGAVSGFKIKLGDKMTRLGYELDEVTNNIY